MRFYTMFERQQGIDKVQKDFSDSAREAAAAARAGHANQQRFHRDAGWKAHQEGREVSEMAHVNAGKLHDVAEAHHGSVVNQMIALKRGDIGATESDLKTLQRSAGKASVAANHASELASRADKAGI